MTELAMDTETRGLEWFENDSEAEPGHGNQRPFLAQWTEGPGDGFVCDVRDPAGMAQLKRALDRSNEVTAHNFSFDCHQFEHSLDLPLLDTGKKLIDTDLLARVALPERQTKDAETDESGYRLMNLMKTYIGPEAQEAEAHLVELAKSIGIRLKGDNATPAGYWHLWRAYPTEVENYARLDAEGARDLRPILESKLTERTRPVWEMEQRAMPTLIRAERRGVATDQSVVEALKAEYEPMADQALARVQKELGDVDLGSPDQLREALLMHGVPLYRETQKGKKLATHKFALKEFEPDFPVLADLATWRQASKFLSTYIKPMLGREVVHPSIWQIGAWTGRTSMSKPNLQNLPVRSEKGDIPIRAALVPRPGYCFVVSDYDAIEVRLLAYYLNDDWYKHILQTGELDPHSWMASNIWGGEPADYAKGGPNDKKRSLAKNVLFAIVYGAGAPRVMDMLAEAGMPATKPQARALILAVKTSLPRYLKLADTGKTRGLPRGRIPRQIMTKGYLHTIMGRRQVVPRDKAYVGLNAAIQGGATDIFKAGIIATAEAIAHLGAHLILFVHDELGAECPIEHAEECRTLMGPAMVGAYDLDPSLAVTTHICRESYAEGK